MKGFLLVLCVNTVCMCTDMSVEALLVEETTAGWRTPERKTGPSPLLPTSAWNSKMDSAHK